MGPRNPYLCIVIVGALAGAGLIGLVGMLLLSARAVEPPQAVVAVVSGAFGALASFLVNPPRGSMGLDGGRQGAPPAP